MAIGPFVGVRFKALAFLSRDFSGLDPLLVVISQGKYEMVGLDMTTPAL